MMLDTSQMNYIRREWEEHEVIQFLCDDRAEAIQEANRLEKELDELKRECGLLVVELDRLKREAE